MPREMHAMFRLTPLQSDGCMHGQELTPCLFTTISASSVKMKELIMEPTGTQFHRFRMAVHTLCLLACQMPPMTIFMSNLTKLRLEIDQRDNNRPHTFRTGIVARHLSHARNLECLFLEINRYRYVHDSRPAPSTLHLTLGGCEFPELRTLVLAGHKIVGDEVLPLLASSSGLKHLVLESCQLEGYLWKHLVEKIKARTQLEALHMNILTGGFEVVGEWHHYADYHGEVGNYLFRDGPNPFSINAMARYIDEWYFSKYRDHPPPSKAEEYYNKHF